MAKTPEGKAVASRNAYKHGAKSAETCTVRNWLKGLRFLAREFHHPDFATARGHQIEGGVVGKE